MQLERFSRMSVKARARTQAVGIAMHYFDKASDRHFAAVNTERVQCCDIPYG